MADGLATLDRRAARVDNARSTARPQRRNDLRPTPACPDGRSGSRLLPDRLTLMSCIIVAGSDWPAALQPWRTRHARIGRAVPDQPVLGSGHHRAAARRGAAADRRADHREVSRSVGAGELPQHRRRLAPAGLTRAQAAALEARLNRRARRQDLHRDAVLDADDG